MSKKRLSAEASHDDEETTEDSDAFQQEDNAKREKLCTFSETTLQDIPIEILHCILVKAIAMEVENMKPPKSVRKEKADLVISRLGTVCSQWSIVLSTDFFRAELHRALDAIPPPKFRMEFVHVQRLYFLRCYISGITMLKDDLFLLCVRDNHEHSIKVYDRNNMAEAKDVIELTGVSSWGMAACNVLNCVFLEMTEKTESQSTSVLRISKDEDDEKFSIHPWISDISWPISSMSVSDEGMVILTLVPDELGPHLINIYKPNGLLQHEIVLSQDVYGYELIDTCVMRSNGNLVLGSVYEDFERNADLTEIDTNGTIQRQYKSSLEPRCDMLFMSFVDEFDRLLIHDLDKGIELLDSELNPLDFTGPQPDKDHRVLPEELHFDRKRNEVVCLCSTFGLKSSLLKIFRLIVE